MSRKAKGKGFKMKGHALPGINQRSETPNIKDGRSASSPFQQGFGPPPVGEEPIDQRSSGIPIDRDEGLTIQEKIERRIREKRAAEERARGRGFEPTPDKTPMKNYKNPQDYKVFNMGNEPTPMKQVTIPGVTVSGEPGEFIGDWKETKNKIKNMSRGELRRAWADMVDQMGDQDYYYDRTRKLKIPIPKRFSSRAEKEDFILKQTMKDYQKPDESQAMTHETYKKYVDAGIDPTTMKDIDNSPLNQVPLQPGENDAITPATEKDSKQEIINDLEDRIEFIREDIWNQQEGPADAEVDESQATKEQAEALKILNKELERIRNDQRMEEALKRDEELGPNPDEVD